MSFFVCKMSNGKRTADIGVFIESETGSIDANTWRKDIATAFPIRLVNLSDCYIHSVNSGESVFCEPISEELSEGQLGRVSIIHNSNSDTCAIRIEADTPNATIYGNISLSTTDRKYCFIFRENSKKYDT